jgi:hypothetical protein
MRDGEKNERDFIENENTWTGHLRAFQGTKIVDRMSRQAIDSLLH